VEGGDGFILISVTGKIFYSLRGRSPIRIRRAQIPQIQQVAGDFREEARRLLHHVTSVLEL
jgi:hypothetical protein